MYTKRINVFNKIKQNNKCQTIETIKPDKGLLRILFKVLLFYHYSFLEKDNQKKTIWMVKDVTNAMT